MDQALKELISFATTYGLNVVGALLILLFGRIGARFTKRTCSRLMTRAKVDPMITGFAGNLAYTAVIAFAVVAALAKFGIETTSFVAILGAASFAVGMALQGSLSNFAAGVMILLFRPFRVGDFIEAAGVSGSVKEIQLFATILATPDNVQIVVPNSTVSSGTIKNFSAYDTRRLDLPVGIGYASAIPDAKEAIEMIMENSELVLNDPAPIVKVSELADSSVNLVVRIWVNRADYWNAKCDLTQAIKEEFDKRNIEIPFPQRVVHMMQG